MLRAVVAAVAAGSLVALQSMVLGGFRERAAALTVALWVHVVGGLVAAAAVLLTRRGLAVEALWQFPQGLLAGVCGVGIVALLAAAVGPLGIAATLAIVTGAQLLLALVLESAGATGAAGRIDATRLLGVAAVVGGVLLIFGRRGGG